jgi:hypothetical protein
MLRNREFDPTCPERLTRELCSWWSEADLSMPRWLPVFSPAQQAARERLLNRYLDAVESELRTRPMTPAARSAAEERLTAAFRTFAAPALDFDERHLDLLLTGGFAETGRQMARAAHEFDPQICTADIFQASRNAWTTNGLQALFGLPVRLTPAIFAYSMLYPVTDNFLDRPAVSRAAKLSFNARFGARLAGAGVEPLNSHEEQVWHLISLVESQYSRAQYPGVFASLLAIHRAQEASLQLHRQSTAGSPDVLRISFEKGGASVLADAWLAAGALSPPEEEAALAWGVLLQLGDDLQDVEADARTGILTVFSSQTGGEPLDAVTNRTFHFGARVLATLDAFGSPGSNTAKELIRNSFFMLLTSAAGEACARYSEAYIRELETHSPFRFSFLADRRRRVWRERGLIEKLATALATECLAESEPAWGGMLKGGFRHMHERTRRERVQDMGWLLLRRRRSDCEALHP